MSYTDNDYINLEYYGGFENMPNITISESDKSQVDNIFITSSYFGKVLVSENPTPQTETLLELNNIQFTYYADPEQQSRYNATGVTFPIEITSALDFRNAKITISDSTQIISDLTCSVSYDSGLNELIVCGIGLVGTETSSIYIFMSKTNNEVYITVNDIDISETPLNVKVELLQGYCYEMFSIYSSEGTAGLKFAESTVEANPNKISLGNATVKFYVDNTLLEEKTLNVTYTESEGGDYNEFSDSSATYISNLYTAISQNKSIKLEITDSSGKTITLDNMTFSSFLSVYYLYGNSIIFFMVI